MLQAEQLSTEVRRVCVCLQHHYGWMIHRNVDPTQPVLNRDIVYSNCLPLSISDFKTSNVFFRVKYDLKEDSVPGAGSPEAFCIDFQVRQMS